MRHVKLVTQPRLAAIPRECGMKSGIGHYLCKLSYRLGL